ncbi:rho-related GTP-binding protein Rho6 isoform X2 [Larus michahellis]|uniref:rho-related GTP-binding protein Rho6 isoform X2 n=1 Tax=Larus michahellis TaxID=119627 RepID=UPI003D9BF560
MRERRSVPAAPARCKLVLVGDVQCGKTAMLQVLAKDCYPEVLPTTTMCAPSATATRTPSCSASTSAAPRPLTWKTEILDYCPNTRVLLIGCKTDLRTDLSTLMELSHQKQAPISYEQGCATARQLGAEGYLECSAFTSEKSVHSIFRTVSSICLSKTPPQPPKSPPRSLSKRLLHLPSRSELISSAFKKEKAKSCSVM